MISDVENILPLVLGPIAEGPPQGVDPRLNVSPSSPYFQLRDARSDARAAERRGEYDDTENVEALRHWTRVKDFAVQILHTVGKDVEVAAWLMEAMIRLGGLHGLAVGIQATYDIFTEFWPDFYPSPDEDGVEARFSALAGLNGVSADGTLIQALRKLELYRRSDGAPFLFWQYEQSEEVEGIGDSARKKQRLEAGVVPFAGVEEEASRFGQTSLTELYRSSRDALRQWRALDAVMTDRLGKEAPSTARVTALLEKLARIASRYVSVTEEDAPETMPEETVVETSMTETTPEAAAPAVTPPAGGKRSERPEPTREEMLQQLIVVAKYFEKHEPQSPLAETLYEAVRRARLSWNDLLVELVDDPTARAAILSRLGITTPSSSQE
ncbi:type VI secretion system protein TssA [Acetobacter sp.]|jgi:type VI secretion system protein ImpA|uniref:type VI secretion system protein TssA n=1 Tax=Acetobacter sp. TaxID=440 RepID=UPI0025C60D0E|nr:type VI secretion system protein TssA [Acetobacter sp.]MCH4092632.1 type VI secretion system protein TssA [Acetobacter sp.]MCI1299766.1 type VI secretion system protein TssA [Acetobacter sp.]MCI1315354.1 type VI secretion system protein TssA [Acetobacter sp.]